MPEPLRTCAVCRTKLPKSKLQRWVARAGKLVQADLQISTGRGYYSCSVECAEKIAKRHIPAKDNRLKERS